jgi:hypothetical protein
VHGMLCSRERPSLMRGLGASFRPFRLCGSHRLRHLSKTLPRPPQPMEPVCRGFGLFDGAAEA